MSRAGSVMGRSYWRFSATDAGEGDLYIFTMGVPEDLFGTKLSVFLTHSQTPDDPFVYFLYTLCGAPLIICFGWCTHLALSASVGWCTTRIMLRWIRSRRRGQRELEEEELNAFHNVMRRFLRNQREGDDVEEDNEEIPVLMPEDIDRELRINVDRLNRPVNNRPFWLKLVDAATVTLFPMLLARLLRNLFSLTTFTNDIVADTENFIRVTYSHKFKGENDRNILSSEDLSKSSLLLKFYDILLKELTIFRPESYVLKFLTLAVFYIYMVLSSAFVMMSFFFVLLCLTYMFTKRWSYLDKFILRAVRDGGVF